MKKPDIVFDVDGVLLSYMDAFTNWMLDKHGYDYIGERLPRPTTFSMLDLYPALEIVPYIKEFSESDEFATIGPIDGAIEGIKKLSRDFNIHAITAAGTSSRVAENRKINLQKILGWDESWPVHVVGLGASKAYYLNMFDEGTIFVDDHIKNIKDALNQNLDAIWFKSCPNHYLLDNDECEAREIYKVIHGWPELLDTVYKKYPEMKKNNVCSQSI